MTTINLERGKDIQYEILYLKEALHSVNEARIFRTYDGSMKGSADPFLSVLNLQVRELAVSEITKKISQLENEFDSL